MRILDLSEKGNFTMKKNFRGFVRVAVVFVLLLTAAIAGLAVPASAEGETKRLMDLEPGAIVEFAGQDWILLEPETGYVLRKEVLPYELNIWSTNLYHSMDYYKTSDTYQTNIGYYLNGTDYEFEVKTGGIGFLEKMSSEYPWEVEKILPQRWSNGTELDDWSYPNLYSFKVGLLSYTEYQKYKDLIQAYPVNYNWWLRTFRDDKYDHLWYVAPDGTLSSAWEFNDIGQVPRPPMYIDPYIIAASGGDGYVINEACQTQTFPMKATPVAGVSPYSYAAAVVVSPSLADGSIALRISSSELPCPPITAPHLPATM
jgi:hypothetical protein